MTITRRDNRDRFGIVWFDTEDEAEVYARDMLDQESDEAIRKANLGLINCGREPAFDGPDDFAVVVP